MLFALLALAFTLQATPLPSPSPSGQPPPPPPPTPGALSASPAAVTLLPNQSQTVIISGSASALTAALDTPLVAVAIDQASHAITLTASPQTGSATLTVSDQSGASIQIPVRVALPAATVPASLLLRVTGNPVDQAWLRPQLQQAVLKAMQLKPGISSQSVQLGAYSLPPQLLPGVVASVPIAVHIAGGEQFSDVDAQLNVTLQNVALDPFAPALLYYDDDPEKIGANGVLYRAQVNPGMPARLYYYHQNMNDARRLMVLLTTPGTQTSTVQLIDASAGPNIDVMSVGHAVTRDFLVRKPHNVGVLVDVTPGGSLEADDFPAMHPLDGTAGSIDIRIVSGVAATVTVVAVPTNATTADIAAFANAPTLPGDGHNRTGVFDIRNYGETSLAYTVGGADAQVQYGIGTPPRADATTTGHDYGEYGVLRTLNFDISNTGTQPATLYLYERPLGGVVRSSFLVDGQLIELGCARVSNRYAIGAPLAVNPGSSRVVVQTMTDGGSNYPLEVGITATPPLPATPPMSAPDGCFPKPPATPPASPLPSPSPFARYSQI